ncbi:hypothetical protein PIB30_052940 [Stylosanthes scabra]|uniref:Uncharacterized protein n=1 Tax=Stylosanthes scabra TaxID=79078 RepID=A0ABU6XIJ1_9FABA|nr:hypothetical protein [Stylosanthes scabra]
MSQIYRRLDQQQEESRKSFEAINTRMDRMDDQLSFLCYSNQMVNETMYYPYQNTTRQFREMEAQGVPVTIANLAIHRHREEEMNQERMRHNQTVQEAAAEKAREANKGKVREVVPDSDEDMDDLVSGESEEWFLSRKDRFEERRIDSLDPKLFRMFEFVAIESIRSSSEPIRFWAETQASNLNRFVCESNRLGRWIQKNEIFDKCFESIRT